MASAWTLAADDLDTCATGAAAANVDFATYGQALIWTVLQRYRIEGRSADDIRSELQFAMDNFDDDDPILCVTRN